ncbi:hypothetical protein KFE25_006257 [Diacronema lutheri]|uniref:Uncharacterized protein n=1 Tax=Diacronema lutheri TaxID=2081491 RepID=A0A8J5XWI9_DIALT|nr:hypothetical protein KFE25_006257 [Diacronema lutheri]
MEFGAEARGRRFVPGVFGKDAHDDGVWAAAWCSGGRLLTGSADEQLKLWTVGLDALSGGGALSPVHLLGVVSVSTAADGSACASSGLDGQINLWALTDEGCEHTRAIDAGPGECWKIALHPRGGVVANGTQNGCVHVWDTLTGERTVSLHPRGGKFVLTIAFSPDGALLASATTDGGVAVFDVATGVVQSELGASTVPVRALAFSPDSALLGVGADDASFTLYDVKTGAVVNAFSAHAGWILSASFSPTDGVLATSSTDRQVKLWDVGTRKCVQAFGGVHTDSVWQVAFDSSGERLVSVGEDKRVQVYNALTT